MRDNSGAQSGMGLNDGCIGKDGVCGVCGVAATWGLWVGSSGGGNNFGRHQCVNLKKVKVGILYNLSDDII